MVRRLASATGESMTEAIGAAVEERLRRVRPARSEPVTVDSILDLVRSYKLQPINDGMTDDEILGYGPNGYCE
jgi:hypothetical protein